MASKIAGIQNEIESKELEATRDWNEHRELLSGKIKAIEQQKIVLENEISECASKLKLKTANRGFVYQVEFVKKKTMGLNISLRNDELTVVGYVPDGPVEVSKLIQVNDVILAINHENIVGFSMDESVKMIRASPEGSLLHLKMYRYGRDETRLDAVDEVADEQEHLLQLERLLLRTSDQLEDDKQKLYFPKEEGFQFRFGSEGVYIGMNMGSLEYLVAEFTLSVDPTRTEAPVYLKIHGKGEQGGAILRARGYNVKLIGEPGSSLPNCDFEELTITSEVMANVPLVFKQSAWDVGTGFKVKLLKIVKQVKGRMKLPQSILKWILNQAIPRVIRHWIRENLPRELGVYIFSTGIDQIATISGEIAIRGHEIAILDTDLTMASPERTKVLSILGLDESQVDQLVQLMLSHHELPQLMTLAQLMHYYGKYSKYPELWETLVKQWNTLDFPFDCLMRRVEEYTLHPVHLGFTIDKLNTRIGVQRALSMIVSYFERTVRAQHEEWSDSRWKTANRRSNSMATDLKAIEDWYLKIENHLSRLQQVVNKVQSHCFINRQKRDSDASEYTILLKRPSYNGCFNLSSAIDSISFDAVPYSYKIESSDGILQFSLMFPSHETSERKTVLTAFAQDLSLGIDVESIETTRLITLSVKRDTLALESIPGVTYSLNAFNMGLSVKLDALREYLVPYFCQDQTEWIEIFSKIDNCISVFQAQWQIELETDETEAFVLLSNTMEDSFASLELKTTLSDIFHVICVLTS